MNDSGKIGHQYQSDRLNLQIAKTVVQNANCVARKITC